MNTPIYDATALHLARVHARRAVRAALRHVAPRCGCGRFVTTAGACSRCDGAVAA